MDLAFKRSLGIRYFPFKSGKLHAARSLKEAREKNVNVLEWREHLLTRMLAHKRYQYVRGHFRCTEKTRKQFETEWNFVTILRNPVERWISEYFFNRYKKDRHQKHDMDLDEYLETDFAHRTGLAYVNFFVDARELTVEDSLKAAIENLETFSAVGVLEDIPSFKNAYAQIVKKGLPAIPTKNINPLSAAQMESTVTPNQMRKIREICRVDMEIYQHFKTKSGSMN